MLAYAAHRPVAAKRGPAPHAMLAIIAIHVAGIAALMSAKMDLPTKFASTPTIIDMIREDDPPPPQDPVDSRPQWPLEPSISLPMPLVPSPPIALDPAEAQPTLPFDKIIRLPDPGPRADPTPTPAPVKVGPRLATPGSELRPPYPRSKLASGEEAVLRLNLTIDERGRVIAVDPIGRADGTFLEAARRHLIAHWRYKPATEDGRAVGTTMAVTLRFQLEA